jgi:hypothetical protein
MIQTSKRAFGLLNGKTATSSQCLPFYVVTAYRKWAVGARPRSTMLMPIMPSIAAVTANLL